MSTSSMRVAARSSAWLLLAAATAAAGAQAAPPVPPQPKAYFNDSAELLEPATGDRLDAKLRAFEAATGHQVVVAVFPALPTPSLEDFTVRTAQAWRVGRKGLDDGVVLFVFVRDRKLRLEVGYGLEHTIPDAVARRILDDVIAPRLRAGDPAGALEAGVDAIFAAAQGQRMPQALVSRAGSEPQGHRAITLSSDDLQRLFFLFVCLVASILAARQRQLLGDEHPGRVAAIALGAILFTLVGMLFAFRWLTRIAALTAGLSLLDLSGPAFVRKLTGTGKGRRDEAEPAPAAERIASAWLSILALVLCVWCLLPNATWQGWTLASVATFLAFEGIAALCAWRTRRYWALRLTWIGTMATLVLAFFFTGSDFFGLPALVLPVVFPVAWTLAAGLLTPLLWLLRLKPHTWWFPKGETFGGSSSSYSSGGYSSSSSGDSGFSGGGGSFGGGGASGSW